MKASSTLAAIVALSFSVGALAQSHDMKPADPTATHGMEMKDMDMDGCHHMKEMDKADMKGMDPKKCKEMMGKTKKGDASSHASMHAAEGVVKGVDPAQAAGHGSGQREGRTRH